MQSEDELMWIMKLSIYLENIWFLPGKIFAFFDLNLKRSETIIV